MPSATTTSTIASPRHGFAIRPGTFAGFVLAVACLCSAAGRAASDGEPWIHVDTAASTLTVHLGDRVLARLPDIAIGRGGTSRMHLKGDQRTPIGTFRVRSVREASYFRRFYVINYPTADSAKLALDEGLIDEQTFHSIADAERRGRMPPQNTPLGGNLGIHGLGPADPQVHRSFNWTRGCIAVTNEEIDLLTRWVRVGTKVVID